MLIQGAGLLGILGEMFSAFTNLTKVTADYPFFRLCMLRIMVLFLLSKFGLLT